MVTLLRWFKENSLKVNPKKFKFMILGKTPREPILLDNRLTFKDHVDMLRRTANYKLHALRRIRKYLTVEKTKLLYNTFINSQFNYASVIWMFCLKKDYLKIEKNQYKALKIIYNSGESHEELLTRSNEVSVHQKHLRALATESYKSLADINPDFMKPYFKIKEMPYNLRNGYALKLPSTNSTYYGIDSVLFRACLLRNQLPLSVKQSQSLSRYAGHDFVIIY